MRCIPLNAADERAQSCARMVLAAEYTYVGVPTDSAITGRATPSAYMTPSRRHRTPLLRAAESRAELPESASAPEMRRCQRHASPSALWPTQPHVLRGFTGHHARRWCVRPSGTPRPECTRIVALVSSFTRASTAGSPFHPAYTNPPGPSITSLNLSYEMRSRIEFASQTRLCCREACRSAFVSRMPGSSVLQCGQTRWAVFLARRQRRTKHAAYSAARSRGPISSRSGMPRNSQ